MRFAPRGNPPHAARRARSGFMEVPLVTPQTQRESITGARQNTSGVVSVMAENTKRANPNQSHAAAADSPARNGAAAAMPNTRAGIPPRRQQPKAQDLRLTASPALRHHPRGL